MLPVSIIGVNIKSKEIKEYSSKRETKKDGFCHAHVHSSCEKLGKQHKGYLWFLKEDFNSRLLEQALELNKAPRKTCKKEDLRTEKLCKKCNKVKPIKEFSTKRKQFSCKKCNALYAVEYRKNNPEKIKKARKNYKHIPGPKQLYYKIAGNLRTRLYLALKNNYKKGSAISDLGCSIEELKSYLESKFQPGMTWDNYGRTGWHIDHIIPLASFDLTNKEELLKACYYTNLQPLWAEQNLKKGVK